MENHDKLDQKRLAADLIRWFDKVKLKKPWVWDENPVGKVIKYRLIKIGRWKRIPRGDAEKGGIAREKQRQAEIMREKWQNAN